MKRHGSCTQMSLGKMFLISYNALSSEDGGEIQTAYA
jgi:hypothetical protein